MPRFLLCLPNELIKRVVDYLDRESILKFRAVCRRLSEVAGSTFCQTFFTYRCHALSKESMLTLIDILKHPEFGSHIQTLAFNAILPAVDCFHLKWNNPPWGEEDERHLGSISYPLFSRSRVPQAVGLHYRLAFASPRAIIKLTDADFLIRPDSNFGSYMVNVTESLEELRRPINIEINDYALGDTIKTHGLRRLLTHPGPRMYTVSTNVVLRIILHTVGWMQLIEIPVNRLSIELTSHARAGFNYDNLPLLGYYLHNLLVGNDGSNFKKDMALRLVFGRNDVIENSLDYDPKAGSLCLFGIEIWDPTPRGNPSPRSPYAKCIMEVMFGRIPKAWLSTVKITSLELSGCIVPDVREFCNFIAFQRQSLQCITISDAHIKIGSTWASVIHLFASMKDLKHALSVNLTSMASSGPLNADMIKLVDIVSWEHEGLDLDTSLLDLAARLEAAVVVWTDDPLSVSGLGPRLMKSSNEVETEQGM
ncbi:hypothetical protein KCU73_g10156, partial [Aureobasidium melanogenum]